MKQEKKQKPEVSIDLSDPHFEKTMVFDSFALRRRGNIVFSCFWRKGESGDIEDRFSAAIAVDDIPHETIRSYKSYIAKVGIAPSRNESPLPMGLDFRDCRVVRIIRCCRHSSVGELAMYLFPLLPVTIGDEEVVKALPVAALVSDVHVHIDFIDALIRTVEAPQ